MIKNWKQNFAFLWFGQAVSQFSSSILQFGFMWYIYDTTKSNWLMSAAMFVGFFPKALLGPFVGVVLDRYSRKKIMIIADTAIAIACLSVAVVSIYSSPPVSLVLFIVFIRAVGSAFQDPAINAIVPQIVPSKHLTRSSGLTQAIDSVSYILSPALAGAIFYGKNVDIGKALNIMIFIDVIGAVIGIISLTLTHIPLIDAKKDTRPPNVSREAKEGFKILRTNRGLFLIVLVSMVYSVALMPVSSQFPAISKEHFSGSVSEIETIFAVGLLVASLIITFTGGIKREITSIVFSFMLMSTSLIITAIIPTSAYWAFKICAFFMGVSGPLFWSVYTPLIQKSFPAEATGRVFAITNGMRYFAGPMGLIVATFIANSRGVPAWFFISGVLVLIGGVSIMIVPSMRKVKAPEKRPTMEEIQVEIAEI